MDPVFATKIIQEKYKEKQKYVHMIFVDLEKTYDRVPRDLIWRAMRKRSAPEGYVNVIQDIHICTIIGGPSSKSCPQQLTNI